MSLKFNPFLRLFSFMAVLGLAGACTTASLKELRRTEPSNDPYLAALSNEYLAFAESEARNYDWASSQYFADKGLSATYGQGVEPESFEEWNIDTPFRPQLAEARAELLKVLTAKNKKEKPAIAARTVYFYDCWMEQQYEGWQEEDIASCRDGFYQSLRQLQDVPSSPEKLAEIPVKPLIFSSSYILFFDWNQWTVTNEGMDIIRSAASDLKSSREEDYEVVLNGHADTSGNVEYNLKLSQKRAEAVKAEFVKLGIPESKIRYFAFGESDNRVQTEDNVRERANRRVEIFFNQ